MARKNKRLFEIMTKKARHLIDKVIKMETLLQGANDATSVVKDKEAWYVKQFLKK